MECLNCRGGLNFFASVDKDSCCILCKQNVEDAVRRRLMLKHCTESRLEEVESLLRSYRQLRTLGTPLRASLIGSAIAALQAIQAMEAMEMPPLEGELESDDDGDDEAELV